MIQAAALDAELLRKIKALELKAREVADGVLLGIHHAPHRGRSIEFAEHKEYTPGDDIRRIDWKLYGKSDRLYVKEYEDDTNITALLVLDTSRSMDYRGEKGGPTKRETARVMLASLAYLLLNQSDAAGLTVFGPGMQSFLPPRARQTHFHEILAGALAAEPMEGTDLARALSDLAPMIKGRAMVILFSDLLDEPEPMIRALKLLRHRRHEPIIFHMVDRDEVEFPFERLSIFKDMEGPLRLTIDPRGLRDEYLRHFNGFLAEVKAECEGHGIDYLMVRADEDPALVLGRWLARRSRIMAARGRNSR